MTTLDELVDNAHRTGQMVLTVQAADKAVGADDSDGNRFMFVLEAEQDGLDALVVTGSITRDGRAEVVVQAFTEGETVEPSSFVMPDSVLVSHQL